MNMHFDFADLRLLTHIAELHSLTAGAEPVIGAWTTASLRQSQLIAPKPKAGQVFRAHKVSKRFEQDISATCIAVSYTLKDGRMSSVRVALNDLAPWPCRVPHIESALEGRSPDQVLASHIDDAIAATFKPRDGLRATWAYRSLVTRNLVLSFIQPHLEESLS